MMRIRVAPPTWVETRGRSPRDPPGAANRCGGQATSVDTGMAATTPSEAGLFDSHDRECRRGEEQIGSGMLLSDPKARDQWYELRNDRSCGRISLGGKCFK